MQLSTKTLVALLPYFIQASALASGSGTTTRYWDCCKPSCSWPGKATLAAGSNPVTTCDIHDNPLTDYNAVSGCDGGSAYMSSKESPWAVTDDLAYGYAAVNIAGGSESSWCCACYELTFTSGPVAGKKMVVQATNTGGDLGSNQFDISIPGGGVGIFNGCTTEWGAPSSGWGAQYGGISSNTCSTFPEALQAGCNWRFDWFQNANNPTVDFKQVACPAAITKNSGCTRADDASAPAAAAPSGSAVAAVAPSSSSTPVAIQSTSSAQAASVATSSKAAVVVAGTSSAEAVVAVSSSAPAVIVSTSTPSPVKATTSSASAKATGSSTHSTSSSTLSKSSTSSTHSASSTPAASAGTLQKYYQCGGLGWSGSGSCVAGSTCVVQNAWYSQCL